MIRLDEAYQSSIVADRWRRQYGNRAESFAFNDGRTLGDIQAELAALGGKGTAEEIAAIIGNDSWCRPSDCNECGQSDWGCVQLGEEPDYESATAVICPACLRQALDLAEAAK